MSWSYGPQIAEPRDDFAWAFDESAGKLYVFGGFVKGVKVNDIQVYDLVTGVISGVEKGTTRPASAASNVSASYMARIMGGRKDPTRPTPRTGSRMVLNAIDSCLYIFGGQNKNAESLNDLWRYSLAD